MTLIKDIPNLPDLQADDKVIIHDVSTVKEGLVTVQEILDLASGLVASVNGQTGAVVLGVNDLDDTDAPSPNNGDVLVYNTVSGNWEAIPQSTLTNSAFEASAVLFSDWEADTTSTVTAGTGQVAWDNAVQVSANTIFVNYTDDNSTLIDNFMKSLFADQGELYIFDTSNVNNFQRWRVTGFIDHTTYAELAVTLIDSSATFTDAQQIKVGFLRVPNTVISVNGQEGTVILDLDDINDVDVSSPADGAHLEFNNISGNWEAVVPPAFPVTSVNTETGDVVLTSDDIDDTGEFNKWFTQDERDKLSAIEPLADVTDEFNVVDSLSGATLDDETSDIQPDYKVLIQDTNDSDNLKYVTAQSIANLGATSGPIDGLSDVTITAP